MELLKSRSIFQLQDLNYGYWLSMETSLYASLTKCILLLHICGCDYCPYKHKIDLNLSAMMQRLMTMMHLQL